MVRLQTNTGQDLLTWGKILKDVPGKQKLAGDSGWLYMHFFHYFLYKTSQGSSTVYTRFCQ